MPDPSSQPLARFRDALDRPAGGRGTLVVSGLLLTLGIVAAARLYGVRTPWSLGAALSRDGLVGVLLLCAVGITVVALQRYGARLRASERLLAARLDTITKQANDVVLLLDESLRIVDLNDRAEQAYGRSREDLLGRQVVELQARDSSDDVLRHLGRARQGVRFETRQVGAGGREFAVDVSLRAFTLDGRILYQALVRDETDRKHAEARLRLLSRAVAQSPVSVVITDASGRIEYVNPKFEEVSGYTADEVRGANPRVLKSGEMSQEEYADLWRTILGGHEWRGVFHNRRKDGSLYWETATISPIVDDSGRLTHFVGIKEDVTAHRELEDRLRHAQKMEAIGRLAGGIAHDFNNLLTVIRGYGELVREGLTAHHPVLPDVDEMLKASERAAAVTRQLLAFSRKQILQPTTIDLNVAVADIRKMLGRLIGEDISLEIAPSPYPCPVVVDTGQIEQLLLNLALNARDAMPRGGRLVIGTSHALLTSIPSTLRGDLAPGQFVVLTVTDSGVGMTPDVQTHLFEPFFSTKPPGKGTGLGLATVYGIVRQSGGGVAVDTEVGHGTTFSIHLPLARAGPQPESEAPPRADKRGWETILLVEDEAHVRAFARRVLEGRGYRVLEAADGQQALELVHQDGNGIALLLTDVVMPGISGPELSRALRDRLPRVRTLFMSGYPGEVARHPELTDSAVPILAKPFTSDQLAVQVRHAIDA